MTQDERNKAAVVRRVLNHPQIRLGRDPKLALLADRVSRELSDGSLATIHDLLAEAMPRRRADA